VACAATSGICTETKQALVESLPANWESCIRGDGPGDDFETCSERFPATRTAYDAHWSCLEASCGDAVCTDVSRIFTLCEYSQDGGGACDACIMASCCERTAACMNDPTCSACASTTTPDAACRANTTLQAMYACLGGTCEAECGEYVAELVMQVVPGAAGDAGSPDAGGSVVGPTADGSTTPSAPSGCSCRTGQHRSASLGIVWALVAWLGARRRRPSS
jgi:MYXO-CTERM domain-containing protein